MAQDFCHLHLHTAYSFLDGAIRIADLFPKLEQHLAGRAASSEIRGAGPFDQRAKRRHAQGVALVGDAAGYVLPLLGSGLTLNDIDTLCWNYWVDSSSGTVVNQYNGTSREVALEMNRQVRVIPPALGTQHLIWSFALILTSMAFRMEAGPLIGMSRLPKPNSLQKPPIRH